MQKEHFEVLLEDISSKFDLVLEGHQVLHSEIRETRTELKKDIELCNFKIDTLNKKIDGVDAKLSKKIDGVAADLKAHRAETEAHHGMYRVKES
jgi:chaperonin cofactor prefoldin